jgi:hypothetical protein
VRSFLIPCLLLGALAGAAAAGEEEAVLDRGFAFADAEESAFKPVDYRVENHFWVHDGDGELREEGRSWQRARRWSPDSTEILEQGNETLFKKEKPDDEQAEQKRKQGDKEDEDGEDNSMELDFLTAARRRDYHYVFAGWEERDGARLAAFTLEAQHKRKGLWEGRFWLDPQTGCLRAIDLAPVKKRLGLKSLRLQGQFRDFQGILQPESIEMDLEVKLPLIVHLKIRSTSRFSEYRLVD